MEAGKQGKTNLIGPQSSEYRDEGGVWIRHSDLRRDVVAGVGMIVVGDQSDADGIDLSQKHHQSVVL